MPDFCMDEDLLREMYAYCRRDVEVERLAAKASQPLTDAEFASFVAAEKINDAGLHVDVEFADAAGNYAEQEVQQISDELSRLTDGEVTSPRQYQRLKNLLLPYAEQDDRIQDAMTVTKKDRRTGEETSKTALDRDARRKLLELVEADPDILPDDVVEVINLIDEAGRSSVHKFNAMVSRSGDAGRVQGAYMFSGAGQTGRFSSVGLQVHNFPRRCAQDPDQVRDDVIKGRGLDNVMDTLASMLRPSIVAPDGYTFVCGDWSAIEARILPWLTDSHGGQEVLDVFNTNDADPDLPDIYKVEYGKAYGKPAADVTKSERAIGKVLVLALGYQGGYRAFQAMARAYQVSMPDEEAEGLKEIWRANNPWAVEFWYDLQNAAMDAVRYPGSEQRVGRLTYYKPDTNPSTPLYCFLPSGRPLAYPFARIDIDEDHPNRPDVLSAIKATWKPKRGENEWPRINLYGGLLAENATQGVGACVLRAAMADLVERDWPVVGHTHDELLLEVEDSEVDEATEELRLAMTDLPAWTEGLPMAVEIWSGRRYRK